MITTNDDETYEHHKDHHHDSHHEVTRETIHEHERGRTHEPTVTPKIARTSIASTSRPFTKLTGNLFNQCELLVHDK